MDISSDKNNIEHRIVILLSLLLIALLFISTLWLRFVDLGYSNFQGDEVLALCHPGVTQRLQDFLMGQRKGPIQYLITCLYGVYDPSFSSEFLIRVPFALANTISVGLFYLLVRQYFNTKIALYAALLMATNGLFVAFARIVQYQSITIFATISALYFLTLAVFHSRWKITGLYVGLIAVAISILSHFDGFFVVPPAAYLIFHWFKERGSDTASRSYRWHLVPSIIIAVTLVASFYIPYLLNVNDYQLKYWSERMSGVASNSLKLFEIYNPTSVVYIYIALVLLSLVRVRRNFAFTLFGIWLLPSFIFIEWVMTDPRTHFYTYLIPSLVFAAIGLDVFGSSIERLLPMAGRSIAISACIILFLFFFSLSHTVFIDRQAEYPWEPKKFLLWELTTERVPGMMGFQYFCDWKEINQFLDDQSAANKVRFISNDKALIASFYMPKYDHHFDLNLNLIHRLGDNEGIYAVICERPQLEPAPLLGHPLTDWEEQFTPIKVFRDEKGKVLGTIYFLTKAELKEFVPQFN
jgi:4-amino-4-deoxy-L-arabinose transferase-like glycosyltransferase